jgi:hypothetical protein
MPLLIKNLALLMIICANIPAPVQFPAGTGDVIHVLTTTVRPARDPVAAHGRNGTGTYGRCKPRNWRGSARACQSNLPLIGADKEHYWHGNFCLDVLKANANKEVSNFPSRNVPPVPPKRSVANFHCGHRSTFLINVRFTPKSGHYAVQQNHPIGSPRRRRRAELAAP